MSRCCERWWRPLLSGTSFATWAMLHPHSPKKSVWERFGATLTSVYINIFIIHPGHIDNIAIMFHSAFSLWHKDKKTGSWQVYMVEWYWSTQATSQHLGNRKQHLVASWALGSQPQKCQIKKSAIAVAYHGKASDSLQAQCWCFRKVLHWESVLCEVHDKTNLLFAVDWICAVGGSELCL